MKKLLTAFALVALLLSGCESTGPTYESAANDPFIKTNYSALQNLLTSLNPPLDKSAPIIVATLVNVDELTQSSRLGRSMSEQFGGHLSRRGYTVIELKLRGDIFVKQPEGELLLSREIKNISLSHKAQAVLVGTYAAAQNYVYVNLKMVGMSGDNNTIIGSHDYALPMDSNVRSLLYSSVRR